MTNDAKIYAKEEQIKLIDNILCSLCSLELTSEGRKYLKKMKQRVSAEIVQLKYIESDQISQPIIPRKSKKTRFQNTLKNAW
jgi:hypothetical protein